MCQPNSDSALFATHGMSLTRRLTYTIGLTLLYTIGLTNPAQTIERESSMKRRTLFPTTLTAVFLTIAFIAPAQVSGNELFPDKGLEAAVRAQVYSKRNNEQPLTKDDVKRVSVVIGNGKEIKSLEGLEHCVAVEKIDLGNNKISDISQLSDLTLLLSINLSNNKIKDIKPLAKLERVQHLELENNKVSDLRPLKNITNMRSLYLSGNRIGDIGTLKRLSKVASLNLEGNPIKDFSPLGEMKRLDNINLSNCGVVELGFLKPLRSIMTLRLSENEISDLYPLLEMAKKDKENRFAQLWRISLDGNPLGESAQAQIGELRKLGGRISLEKKQ